MTSMTSFMKIYELVQVLLVGGHRQTGDLISLLHFFKESRLKSKLIDDTPWWKTLHLDLDFSFAKRIHCAYRSVQKWGCAHWTHLQGQVPAPSARPFTSPCVQFVPPPPPRDLVLKCASQTEVLRLVTQCLQMSALTSSCHLFKVSFSQYQYKCLYLNRPVWLYCRLCSSVICYKNMYGLFKTKSSRL
jgi:hypothetical protein